MGNKKKKGKKHNRAAAAAAAAAASTVTTPVADEQQAAAEEAAYWAYITGGGTVYSSGDACAHSSGAPQQPPAPTPAPAATINGGVVAEHDDDDDDDDDDDCTGTVAVTTTALRGQQPDMVPATSPACGKSSTTGGATAAAAASHHNTTAAAAAVPRRRLRVAEGQVVPYTTFAPTAACVSAIAGAGTGLVTLVQLPAFAWVGLYPGTVSKKINRKLESHTMGSRDNLYIIADPQVQEGVHMVNEASPPAVVNVFYAKLRNGYVLYFAGSEIAAGEELFTCALQRCASPRRAACIAGSSRPLSTHPPTHALTHPLT
jgi:hypothetical protein